MVEEGDRRRGRVKLMGCGWEVTAWAIQAAKELFGRLQKWQVEHVRRTANSVVHRLSKYALETRVDRLWFDNLPAGCIHDLVLAEQRSQ